MVYEANLASFPSDKEKVIPFRIPTTVSNEKLSIAERSHLHTMETFFLFFKFLFFWISKSSVSVTTNLPLTRSSEERGGILAQKWENFGTILSFCTSDSETQYAIR